METQNGLGRESPGEAGGRWEKEGYVGIFFVTGEEDKRANKRANARAEKKEEEEERLETQNSLGRESTGQAGGGWEEEGYIGIFFVTDEEDKRANKRANERADKKDEEEEQKHRTA